MSHDVWLEAEPGGADAAEGDRLDANYTSNCDQMLREAASISLVELDGIRCGDAARFIRLALLRFERDPSRFRAMEPSNGWGDLDGFAAFLREIADACEAAPGAVLRVSG